MLSMAAVDIGAQSGRVALGRFDGERLSVAEVHRFRNTPLADGDALSWDAPALYDGVLAGLSAAAAEAGGGVASVGVDTWGVDFGLLDEAGELVRNPMHHRDQRFVAAMERAFEVVPARELY